MKKSEGQAEIERFLKFLEYKELNPNKSTVKSELSQGLIGKYKSGKVKSMHPDTKSKIFQAFPELNQTWLLTGEGEMIVNPGTLPINKDEIIKQQKKEIAELNQKIMDLQGEILNLYRKINRLSE